MGPLRRRLADAPHRLIRNSTVRHWESAGEHASGTRPGEGESIAITNGRDRAIRRRGSPKAHTGDVEALALHAAESVGSIDRLEPAAELTMRGGHSVAARR
jgi:hypothetical protein